jgi:general secretion pathway protein J
MSRPSEAGFTLLEALASVAIMAAILGGLGALAGQWLPNWRHGFLALQSADLVGLALDRIVEDVAAAEYARLDGGEGEPLFRGEAAGVTFVRQAIGPGAGPRLEIVRIGEVETQQGVELERARASFAPGSIGAFRDATTLLRPPLRLAFAYAGPDGQWRSNWQGDPKLPRAVRLSVRSQTGALVASTAFPLKVTAAPELAAAPQGQKPDAPRAAEKSE